MTGVWGSALQPGPGDLVEHEENWYAKGAGDLIRLIVLSTSIGNKVLLAQQTGKVDAS